MLSISHFETGIKITGQSQDIEGDGTLEATDPENVDLINEPENKEVIQSKQIALKIDTIFKASINVIGQAFQDHVQIPTALEAINKLLKQGVLITREVEIKGYDREEIKLNFNFKRNGFGYCTLEADAVAGLNELAQRPENRAMRVAFRKLMISELEKWGKTQGFSFKAVIPVDTVYRKTDQTARAIFNSVFLSHVDFSAYDSEILKHFKDTWKPNMEEILGSQMSDEDYHQMKVVQMVNIWMPLNRETPENILALLDISSMQGQELRPYTAVRRGGRRFFTALALADKPWHQWIFQFDMKRGDAVIFDSFKTPHTAVQIERLSAVPARESVEIRALFIDYP
ncbi:hypothetical protein [Candidatus Protochlamydia phocaeensis]|uniref:hypothetical protein n=1 Tax=Candidatus Protochlamydia phocaeensis TaxID=1414722 RepID=UPI000838F8B8|nr:hypothetical protein [Candidatus Protochlamydia phocaeensis]